MHRIDDADRAVDLHGPGKDGFTEGTPGVTAATVVTNDWLNDVQENLAEVVEGAGLALVKGDGGQLLEAIRTMHGVDFDSVSGTLRYIAADGTPAPQSRMAEILGAELLPAESTYQFSKTAGDPSAYLSSTTASAWFLITNVRRIVPRNATITRIGVWVTPGAARATTTNRMRLYVKPTGASAQTANDDGTTSPQLVELTGLSLDGDGLDVVAVRTGADATADTILGFEIDYTAHGPSD